MSRICVVGAGLVGATAALALSDAGFEVVLLEQRAPERQVGRLGMDVRNVAISAGSQAYLQSLGVELTGTPYTAMEVWEERGTARVTFAAAEIPAPHLGLMVENSRLQCHLWELLTDRTNVALEVGKPLKYLTVERDAVCYGGDDWQSDAALVVAVDGANSNVRQLLGGEVKREPTGQKALVTVVRFSEPHGGVARQCFLRDGPLALLPGAQSHLCSIVWSQSPKLASHRVGCTDAEFGDELGKASEYRLGTVEAVDTRVAFPLAQHVVPDFALAQRVLVLGDAARVVHPLAGLGVNLGFEDVRGLVAALGYGVDPGTVDWRRFSRRRAARSRSIARLMHGFQGFFGDPSPLAGWLRNTGMRWVELSPGLKRQLMVEAMGLGPIANRMR